ncbi:MAG: methionine--tRNA ligase [Patescibacteria group bacterium]
MEKFYITTTLPYVNADPHIGFALELVQADVIARLHQSRGEEIFFNTGTDEHGLKIYRKALEEKKDPQVYVNEYAAKFDLLKNALNVSYTNFIRTTDPHHVAAAQEFWKRCEKSGDIYKKIYTTKYCVGCELEKTESELVNNRCAIHPNQDIEFIEEENYFFRFSKYEKPLLELYAKHPDFVVPDFRLNEIKKFVERGLDDFSVSRLKSKMPWGVPVPGDEDHVMYVWFDALVNYVSALGWPDDTSKFKQFWPGVQVAGKDNLRQQSAMWQAMLLSAKLPPSQQIFIHGFITHEGQKISKSLGNTVNPIDLTEKYGTDAVRYFLLRGIHAYEDGDWSEARFKEIYNADLANGVGNLVQRVTTLGESAHLTDITIATGVFEPEVKRVKEAVREALEKYAFHLAIEAVWQLVALGDKYVNETKPWEKSGDDQKIILADLASLILNIANILHIFLPETAENIVSRFGLTIAQLRTPKVHPLTIKKGEPLFQRL